MLLLIPYGNKHRTSTSSLKDIKRYRPSVAGKCYQQCLFFDRVCSSVCVGDDGLTENSESLDLMKINWSFIWARYAVMILPDHTFVNTKAVIFFLAVRAVLMTCFTKVDEPGA